MTLVRASQDAWSTSEITNKITSRMADAFLNSHAQVRATHERTDPLA
jgi:hypothetical protein